MDKVPKINNRFVGAISDFVIERLTDSKFPSLLNRKHFFPIQNKRVVNLRTGIVEQRTPAHLFSFERPVELLAPDHPLENATKFFRDIMCGDEKMVDYMQSMCGSLLTPDRVKRGEGPYIAWDVAGSNAQSAWDRLLRLIMGPFYANASKAVFIKRVAPRAGAPTPHLIPLVDARVAVCSEIDRESILDQKFLATWGGGDPITARPKHGREFTFLPMAKLCLMCKHKHKLDGDDQALKDQIRVIPFQARFVDNPNAEAKNEAKKDPMLETKHLSEVFTWMVRGAVSFYARSQTNPSPPESMVEAQRGYFEENDVVQRFLDTQCETGDSSFRTPRTKLYQAFEKWAKQRDPTVMRSCTFYETLNAKNFKKAKVKGKRFISGVRLRE